MSAPARFRLGPAGWQRIFDAMHCAGLTPTDSDRHAIESLIETALHAEQVTPRGCHKRSEIAAEFHNLADAARALRTALDRVATMAGGADIAFLEAVGAEGAAAIEPALPGLEHVARQLANEARAAPAAPPRINRNLSWLDDGAVGQWLARGGPAEVDANLIAYLDAIRRAAGWGLSVSGTKTAARKALTRKGCF